MKKIGLVSLLIAIIVAICLLFVMQDEKDDQPSEKEVQEGEDADLQVEKGLLYGYTIVLDPGHGGKDGGAVGVNDTVEKEVTYITAEHIKRELQKHDAIVELTRQGDAFVELEERVQIAMDKQADLFISIHYDGFELEEVNGITTYYYHQKDEQIARLIHKNIMKEKMNARDRGVTHGDYYVLRENQVPAVLLELGYMTNPDDEERMNRDDFQQHIAKAVVDGMIEFLVRD